MIYKGYEIRLERAGWIQLALSEHENVERTHEVLKVIHDYDDSWYVVYRDSQRASFDDGQFENLEEARQAIDAEVYKNSVTGKDGRPVRISISGRGDYE